MPINRWIGQAAPTPEIQFFVPDNVQAGDKFQLSDGANRYAYTYPLVPYEQDDTAVKRARRVVDEIVNTATGSDLGFGGGDSDTLSFLSSDYGGKPAVKVIGLSGGQPLGLIATATVTPGTSIRIQKMQAGQTGSDRVFTLKWPIVPTSGKWAISASGQIPRILNFNATAAELRTAIESFNLACTGVTVTGSHTAGYEVRLGIPKPELPEPAVLFPIVPIAGEQTVITFTVTENEIYRIGPVQSNYSTTYFEADIDPDGLRTYLTVSNRMGSLASADNLDISTVRISPTNGYNDGNTVTLTFKTLAALERWESLEKKRLQFSYHNASDIGVAPNSDYRRFDFTTALGNQGEFLKIRQTPGQKTTGGQLYNPQNKNFHMAHFARNGTAPTGNSWPLFRTSGTLLTSGLNVVWSEWLSNSDLDMQVKFTNGAVNHDLTSTPPAMALGVSTGEADLAITVASAGSWGGLGVNNNAGYKIETTEQPGIINHELLIPLLSQKVNTLYQFEWKGKRSITFTGVSTIAQIKDAAETLFGAGNCAVSALPKDKLCRLAVTGTHAENEINLRLLQIETDQDDDAGQVEVAVSTTTPMVAYKLKYTFTGGVCGGRWRLVDANGVQSATWFRYVSNVDITPAMLYNAILPFASAYSIYLAQEDIVVETEEVGRNYVLRGFTISFQAQPGGTNIAASGLGSVPFWVGIDASQLKTAEPNYELNAMGEPELQDIQVVALNNKPTGGTFKLSLGASTTAAIAHNASSATVDSALSAIGISANVLGPNGGPWRIRWNNVGPQGLLVGTDNLLTRNNAPTFSAFVDVPGTGPNYFDNDENWSLGRRPVDGDEIVFSDGAVDCCYGLTSTANLDSINIYTTFSGKIGLSENREDASLETLPVWLRIDRSVGTALPIRVGLGDTGEGPPVIRIQTLQRAFDATVIRTRAGLTNKVCSFKSTASGNKLVVVSGDASAGVRPDDVGSVDTLMISPDVGNQSGAIAFSSSAGMSIATASVAGGTATFGQPPASLVVYAGEVTVNGNGTCQRLDVSNAIVRWLAAGNIGKSASATAVLFGTGLTSSSAVLDKIRITSNAHGLSSGDRVYIRSKGAVQNVDGKVYSIVVVDANNFDLVGSLASGTLVGYTNSLQWAVEKAVIVRSGGQITFDSDGRTRDIVAPIVVQADAIVSDVRVSITDLRLWPEFVDALAFLGQAVEIRRSAR